jgi:hypothetical protein
VVSSRGIHALRGRAKFCAMARDEVTRVGIQPQSFPDRYTSSSRAIYFENLFSRAPGAS